MIETPCKETAICLLTLTKKTDVQQRLHLYANYLCHLLNGRIRQIELAQPMKADAYFFAKDEYDLVIIAAEPHGRSQRLLLGELMTPLLHWLDRPLLIAKPMETKWASMNWLTMKQAEPNLSQRFSQQFPELLAQASNVTVLHVMSQMAAAPGVVGQQLLADVAELMTAHSPEGDILTHDVQLLSKIDMDVEPIVRHGLVVEEILAEATDGRYDLVVIGAHLHEGWQRFLLEDVTAQIVLQADRPVLVNP